MTIWDALKELKWLATCPKGDRKRTEIISIALSKHPKIFLSLFRRDTNEMYGPREEMLAIIGVFSGGEQVLARFAIDLWFYNGGEFSASIGDIARRLDNENFENVLTALKMWREL